MGDCNWDLGNKGWGNSALLPCLPDTLGFAAAGGKSGKARGADRAGSQGDDAVMLSKFGGSPEADLPGVHWWGRGMWALQPSNRFASVW